MGSALTSHRYNLRSSSTSLHPPTLSLSHLTSLPHLALRHIFSFLTFDEALCLHRLHPAFADFRPRVQRIVRRDLVDSGPGRPHFCPETWFDVIVESPGLKKIVFSMKWNDQGWGNQKGQIFLCLLRGTRVVAENPHSCSGLAPHEEEEKIVCEEAHPVVDEAIEGDVLRVVRNVGGGGGHKLHVTDFEMTIYHK